MEIQTIHFIQESLTMPYEESSILICGLVVY